jgi:nitrite reductase (NADH) small subunit
MVDHRLDDNPTIARLGALGEEPKVACPFHKKTFSLKTGECLNGDMCAIKTFPVKVENGRVFIGVSGE